MKKLLSLFITASMLLTSCVIPAHADEIEMMSYTAADYDVVQFSNTFDDGTATNAIDNSPAVKVTDTQRLMELSDGSVMTREFFLSFDFRFDTVDGNVSGSISIDKKKSNGDVDKQGPLFTYSEGNLRTQTGGSSYDTICKISPDTWYRAELEGKMVVSGASVTMTVYDAEGNSVGSVSPLNLRQFYAASSNGNPDCFRAYNVSIDNVKLISENPDAINITAASDTIKAGSNTALSYTMTRNGVDVTKYPVTYSVYDENNTTEITEGITISDGALAASISAETQTVTVRASADFGDKTLTGTKQIKINSVDVSGEKFDTVTINGVSEVKAGSSTSFTITASKNGEDVTASLEDGDVVWSVYNCDDLNPNNSRDFSIDKGTLTIADTAIAQDIYIRASSESGNVYGSKQIKIAFSDSQVEEVLGYDACEAANEAATRVESFDGSTAYYTSGELNVNFGNNGGYVLTELDIKFKENGSGFIFKRADGTVNSSFILHDGNLSQQTGGSSYATVMADVDLEAWYHMEVLYSSEQSNASCNVYKYNDDGTKTLVKTGLELNTRNGKTYGKLEVQTGTYIDNIKISVPAANELSLKASNATMFAGETNQVNATALRNGLPIKNFSGITWTVLDSEELPIIDGSVSIDNGLVSVDPMAAVQTITVKATTAAGASATTQIEIMSSEIFTMKNIGVNEDKTKVVKLYVDKNFYYQDDVVFVMAFYDANGKIKAVRTLKTYGSNYSIGENAITVDWDIPNGFDSQTENASMFIWTSL